MRSSRTDRRTGTEDGTGRARLCGLLRESPVYEVVYWLRGVRQQLKWKIVGPPHKVPHFVKRQYIREVARRHRLKVFVETGTGRGDMISALRTTFSWLISIELDPTLYLLAASRFERFSNVSVFYGNSATVLRDVLGQLAGRPVLFWLDAHYSGHGTASGPTESSLQWELDIVLNDNTPGHVVLVDDAHELDGTRGYPTYNDIETLARASKHRWAVRKEDNIVFIEPT